MKVLKRKKIENVTGGRCDCYCDLGGNTVVNTGTMPSAEACRLSCKDFGATFVHCI